MAVAVRQRDVRPRLKLKHEPRILSTRDLAECRSVMDDIQQVGQPVAIDAEGIRLGEKGRMTLLQICTWDGRIYLLDLIDPEYPDHLYFGKKLLISGGVKAMLESNAVEKVTHSCSGDSAALYHQFGIRLNDSHTFDTQAADETLQWLDGAVFPQRRSLSHLADTHGTPQHPLKADHAQWMQTDVEAWGRRPLTKDMIYYASYDVVILIPDLYNKLRRLLDQGSGWSLYRQMVDWTINQHVERDRVLAEKAIAQADGIQRIFLQIQRKHTPQTPLSELSYDEKTSLKLLQENEDEWKVYSNSTVNALEKEIHLEYINTLGQDVLENPRNIIPEHKMKRLYALGKHPNKTIRDASRGLQSEIKDNKQRYSAKPKGRRRGKSGYRA